MRIPEEIISDLVNKLDIVQYIGKYVGLEKKGHNHFGCCPFHEENTPSFSVSETKHIFHCFGCGEGGGIIQFAMQYHKISFIDAVFLLADEIGYDLSNYKQAKVQRKQSPEEVAYYETFGETQKLYSYLLTTASAKEAQVYLQERKIDQTLQKHFGLGYAPAASILQTHFNSKAMPLKSAYEGSLIRDGEHSTYDFFRNRIMFPIKDARGNVIAYTARKLPSDTNEESPKYLNSPETPFFKKGEILYNLDIALPYIKTEKKIYIFEGITDVISAYRNEIKNGVAVLGTALTEEHAKMISRLNVSVVLCFDGDKAGMNAAIKSGDILLQHHIDVTVVQLPSGLDPDTYFEKHTKTDFTLLSNNALDFILYKAHKLKEVYRLSQLAEQNQYLEQLFSSVLHYHQNSDQMHFLHKIAEIAQIEEQRVIQRFQEKNTQSKQTNYRAQTIIKNQQVTANIATSSIEEKMLKILLDKHEIYEQFSNQKGYFTNNDFQTAYRLISEYRLQFPHIDEVDINHFLSIFTIEKSIQSIIVNTCFRQNVDLKTIEDYEQLLQRYFEKLRRDQFKDQKTYNLQKEDISLEQINKLIQMKKDITKK